MASELIAAQNSEAKISDISSVKPTKIEGREQIYSTQVRYGGFPTQVAHPDLSNTALKTLDRRRRKSATIFYVGGSFGQKPSIHTFSRKRHSPLSAISLGNLCEEHEVED